MTYNEAGGTTVDTLSESKPVELLDGTQRSRASAALGFRTISCLHLSCDEAGGRGRPSGQNHRRVYAVRTGKCGASADAGADLGSPWVS
jgi:hypothetical protein